MCQSKKIVYLLLFILPLFGFSQGEPKVDGVEFIPQLAVPSSPDEGDLYYNNVDKTLYFWNGSAWINAGNINTGGDVTAATTFGTDNTLVRTDGVVKGVQSSGVTLDDNDDIGGVRRLYVNDFIQNSVFYPLGLTPGGSVGSYTADAWYSTLVARKLQLINSQDSEKSWQLTRGDWPDRLGIFFEDAPRGKTFNNLQYTFEDDGSTPVATSVIKKSNIDTFAELQAIVADATLVKSGDNVSLFTNDAGYLTTESQTAVDVPFTPAGTIAATDVQAAIEEVATEAGSGSGTIGGSIADNQIAVGSAVANEIEGSAGLTYDGSTLGVTGDITGSGDLSLTTGKIDLNDGGNSVFIGTQAGLNDDGTDNRNVGAGAFAMRFNTGFGSNGLGYEALQNNTGNFSNGFGYIAMQSNTGADSNGFGYLAMQNNSGNFSNGFGSSAMRNNTGADSNGFGYLAMQNNTGVASNGFGGSALRNNTGVQSNGFGSFAMQNNTGASSNGFGYLAMQSNTGSNSNGVGTEAARYNQGVNVNVFGANSFNDFYDDTANAKTLAPADVNTTDNHMTITAHGFGSIGERINIRFNTDTTAPSGVVDNGIYMVEIVDANTIDFVFNNITTQGVGTHTITPQLVYSDVNILGANLDPTRSNQTILGGLSVAAPNSTTTEIDAVGAKALVTKEYADANYADVTKAGTPVDNQIGVWTGDGTLEGTSGLTYDGATLGITGGINASGDIIPSTDGGADLGTLSNSFFDIVYQGTITGGKINFFNEYQTTSISGALVFNETGTSNFFAIGGGPYGDGIFYANSGGYRGGFNFDNLTTSRTYTLPDASGTVMLSTSTGATDDQTAAEVSFTPTSQIASTDVQSAIEEFETEIFSGLSDANNEIAALQSVGASQFGETTYTANQTAVANNALDSVIVVLDYNNETFTIPAGVFLEGQSIRIKNGGSGLANIVAGAGVSFPSTTLYKEGQAITITRRTSATVPEVWGINDGEAPPEIFVHEEALSDYSTDITTGTTKAYWRAPFPIKIVDVRASALTAPVGSSVIIDINEAGSTIFSTRLFIDSSQKTSETSSSPFVLSDDTIADDAEITYDIDQVGSGTAGQGIKVKIYYVKL